MKQSGRRQNQSGPGQDEAFLSRMQAQCAAIEAYRLNVMRRENRAISLDQAAREWIEQYAQSFS